MQVVDYNYDLAKTFGAANQTKTVGADGITSIYGAYIRAYTGTDRLTDFRGMTEAGNKRYSTRIGESAEHMFRISREKENITTGSITHNATNTYGGTCLLYTSPSPRD